MIFTEAKTLQEDIAVLYPFLNVDIREIEQGDEYVCFLEPGTYYLWSKEDWLAYHTRQVARLYKYTDVGHTAMIEQMNEKRRATKKRGQELGFTLARVPGS